MILFFGPYPSPENERDGMIQRVRAIDSLVEDYSRKYISTSYRRNWKKVSEKHGVVTVHRVNFFLHWFFIFKLILAAKCVYVHSVFNVVFALPAYLLRKKIVTDVHGAVPEETHAQGKSVRALIRSLAERVASYRSTALVCVTQRMADHLARKYPNSAPPLILPIFNTELARREGESLDMPRNIPPTMIYAGGLQIWQNIEKMLEFAVINKKYKYLFLTPDSDSLRARALKYGDIDADFFSCPHSQVAEYYRAADFGFLLRDDNIINNVACPTKAIEYMAYGVIPVVLNMGIGDFEALGASFLLLSEMGDPPDAAEVSAMRRKNFYCLERLVEQYHNGSAELMSLLV